MHSYSFHMFVFCYIGCMLCYRFTFCLISLNYNNVLSTLLCAGKEDHPEWGRQRMLEPGVIGVNNKHKTSKPGCTPCHERAGDSAWAALLKISLPDVLVVPVSIPWPDDIGTKGINVAVQGFQTWEASDFRRRFSLVRMGPVARGEDSQVYDATDHATNKKVMIKIRRARNSQECPVDSMEVSIHIRCLCEFVPQLFGVYQSPTLAAMAMETLGMTLRDYMYQKPTGRLSGPELLQVAVPVFSALRFIHETCSVAHCDIHANNIMMPNANGDDIDLKTAKLIDFSRAKLLSEGGTCTVVANTYAISFRPPELLWANGTAWHGLQLQQPDVQNCCLAKTDVFASGTMLLWCAFGDDFKLTGDIKEAGKYLQRLHQCSREALMQLAGRMSWSLQPDLPARPTARRRAIDDWQTAYRWYCV